MTDSAYEHQLAIDIASTWDDPLAFVKYAYAWGEDDLSGWEGPDKWQTEYLSVLGEAVKQRAPGDVVKLAVKAGRGVGKNALQAWLIMWLMSTRPDFAGMAMANTGDQLDDRLWRELALWHRRSVNAHWFTWTATRFYHNDAKNTWGIDAHKWRAEAPAASGGLHNNGRGQCAIIDEASGVADSIFDVVEGTMTDPDSFVFVFGNPQYRRGRFYDIFTRFRARWLTLTVKSTEAKAANQKQIEDAIEAWGQASDYVKWNYMGEFPDTDAQTLIPLNLIDLALLRPQNLEADKWFKPIWGVDVARFGDDRSTVAKRRSRSLMEPVIAWRGLDTMQTAGRIINMYEDTDAKDLPSHIVVDVIGVGSGVVDRLREWARDVPNAPVIVGLNVAERPSVAGKHAKLRDELAWSAREWLSGMDVSMGDKALAAEMGDILYGYTSNGLIKVESKDDAKERLGMSPDLWDAFCATFAVSPVQIKREPDRWDLARRRQKAGGSAWAA